jgi:hypothetical protein
LFHGFSRAQSQCPAKCASGSHKPHIFPAYDNVYDHLPTVGANTYRSVEAISTILTQEKLKREKEDEYIRDYRKWL